MFGYNYLKMKRTKFQKGDDYMKIVNKKKFIISTIIIVGSLLLMILSFNNTYSKAQISYKQNYIFEGDTLWSIAKEEINTNEYYKGKDIRKVVYEIKQINNLENNKDLVVGQKIIIPTI